MRKVMEADMHAAVGPYMDVYGHGPVMIVNDDSEEDRTGIDLAICTDCGYVAHDIRLLAHIDCERSKNPITQTLRERLADDGFPGMPADEYANGGGQEP